MKNQVDAIRSFSNDEGVAHFLNSSPEPQRGPARARRDILDGRTKLLYVAPESLTKKENIEFLAEIPISFFAIDEATASASGGHDFRPSTAGCGPSSTRSSVCRRSPSRPPPPRRCRRTS